MKRTMRLLQEKRNGRTGERGNGRFLGSFSLLCSLSFLLLLLTPSPARAQLIPSFGSDLALTLEITNVFNQLNSVIVNPVTGKAYPNVNSATTDFVALRDDKNFDVPLGTRDPRYEDPRTSGLPPFNPARFLPQRQVIIGLSYRF